MRITGRIGFHCCLAASVAATGFAAALTATHAMEQTAAPASQELVQRGAYLARAGDCIACHIPQEGQPFVGGMPFPLPVGRVYSTNITPDVETGIGRYNQDDFVKVMREGVTRDGEHLFSAMPYPSYAKVSKDDLWALYAYFMHGVKPVRNVNRPAHLSWPLGARSLLAVWNALYLKRGEYAADPQQTPSWNRGAYLVQGLGHCGACHTPRGVGGQEKAVDGKDSRHYLAGATLENWHASPLTGDRRTGLHAWPKEEIVEYLKTGRTVRAAATGPMAGVIDKSTQHLNDGDLTAIAEYLKSLQSSVDEGKESADSVKSTGSDSAATHALRAGDTGMRGSRVYLDNCSACHGSDGHGAARTFPNLARNETVNARDPVSMIHLVLTGSSMPSTTTAPSAFAMPDFGWRLSDGDIADVLSFVRRGWGNRAAEVSPKETARVRKALAKE